MIFDIICLIVIALATFQGFKKGLLRAVLGSVAVYLSVILALRFSHFTSDFLLKNFEWATALPGFSFYIITFFGLLFGSNLLIRIINSTLNWTGLGIFNKAGGALLGGLIALYGISVALWYANTSQVISPELLSDSKVVIYIEPLGPSFNKLSGTIIPLAEGIHEQIEANL